MEGNVWWREISEFFKKTFLHCRFGNSCSIPVVLWNFKIRTKKIPISTRYFLYSSSSLLYDSWREASSDLYSLLFNFYTTSCDAWVEEREKGGRSRVHPITLTCSINSSWEIQIVLEFSNSSSSSLLHGKQKIQYLLIIFLRIGEFDKTPHIVLHLNSL